MHADRPTASPPLTVTATSVCPSLPVLPAASRPPAAAAATGAPASAWWRSPVLWAALAVIAWELTGLDMPVAWALGGSAQGFVWRDHWLLTSVLHSGGRALAWAALLWLWFMVWRPLGPFRRLDRPARLQLAGGTMAAVLLVSMLKGLSPAPCPWDLVAFGGAAEPLSHWQWLARPAVGGHCFPAGHASSAFAFLGGWYVFRPVAPGLARAWLIGVLLAGLVLGLGQQWRGAHFTSHTLWTAWICLAVAALADRLRHRLAPVSA